MKGYHYKVITDYLRVIKLQFFSFHLLDVLNFSYKRKFKFIFKGPPIKMLVTLSLFNSLEMLVV